MKINFPYYVETRKLSSSKAIHPLFEAISNSIDAIDEREGNFEEFINITLERDGQGLLFDEKEVDRELLPIKNILIEDNGIGFRKSHFDAFSELSTVWKKNRGGKGLGRVIWLKVFEFAEIESTFTEGELLKRIRFKFVCENDSIQVEEESEIPGQYPITTSIRLVNCKPEYLDQMPKKRITIAEAIIAHFLPIFMVRGAPNINIKEAGLEDINLSSLFEDYISTNALKDHFVINEIRFDMVHTKVKYHSQRQKDHRVFYIAHGREVERDIITPEKISNLPPRIQDAEENYVYLGYVESDYLNNTVNQSRDSFDIPEFVDNNELPLQIDKRSIEEKILDSVKEYLGQYLEIAAEEKDKEIRRFINDKAPNLSYIYKYHKNKVDEIPYRSIERGNVEQEIRKIHINLRSQFSEEAERVLNIPETEITSAEEYTEKLKLLIEQMNPAGKADLAEYIIHRRMILHMLEKALKIRPEEKYEKEDVIHSYIFPIQSSSDEVTYEEHNLWLLDERLAYNTYIASDKQFGQIPGYENANKEDKRKRVDLFAYVYALVEPSETRSPFRSLDIFEFKRPMRNIYTKEENPCDQIKEYLEIIRRGEATTKDERPLRVEDNGLIYCHAICDFTPKILNLLERDDFEQVGNEDWFIRFHKAYNALIEFKSFDFILELAIKRNQILFDKLGLK